jgi:hypothetical protein
MEGDGISKRQQYKLKMSQHRTEEMFSEMFRA